MMSGQTDLEACPLAFRPGNVELVIEGCCTRPPPVRSHRPVESACRTAVDKPPDAAAGVLLERCYTNLPLAGCFTLVPHGEELLIVRQQLGTSGPVVDGEVQPFRPAAIHLFPDLPGTVIVEASHA